MNYSDRTKLRAELSDDDVRAELDRCGFPGGEQERFQLYVLERDERRLLATAADMEAIGVAIKTLGEEGELDAGPVGVLDRAAHRWLVSPWAGQARFMQLHAPS